MKVETSLNARDRAIRQLNEIYSHAAIVGMDSKALQSKVIEIQSRVKSYPQWVRAYVKGYESCKSDFIFKNQLIHGGFINGKFCSTHSHRDDYYQKQGITPEMWLKESYWLGFYWNTVKGNKPYFLG